MVSKDLPKRGEVWLANFSPNVGNEQKGTRPALVFSRSSHNRLSNLISVVRFTRSLHMQRHPATLLVPALDAGLRCDSLLLLFHIRAVDKSRLEHRLSILSPVYMSEATRILLEHLGA